MIKITFIGAGSTVFVRNVIGDSMRTPALRDAEIALYDIDAERLKDATFVINAIQVGGYDPCTITDFEIPKKYGLRQTITDKDGVDLYPEIKKRTAAKNAAGGHKDMVRFDYIKNFGYYCTESSEHNAEYNLFYIILN